MALTLLEAAKMAPPQEAVYIEEYAASSDVLQFIPFREAPGNALPYNREHTLPGVGFRGVNEGYTESTGVINPQVEVCRLFGGDLDVDRSVVDSQGDRVRSAHELLKVKSLAASWTKHFIKGDSSTNPRVFDGLQRRLTGTQLISNAAAGAALSLNKLDEAIDAVDGASAIVLSKGMRRRLTQASRNTSVGGFISYEADAFGRRLAMYADLPLLVVDQDEEDTDILGFTETSPDGSSSTACTSIYVVSFDEMKCCGIQGAIGGRYGMNIRDLGELEDKPVYRTRIDWYTSIAVMHGRAAARLYGITNAAVTV